jgi:formiminotetrahydrofolate cyclodeaminase
MRLAADVPLRIAGAGADVVTLAEQLADEGHPDLAADAAAALLVAESGVRVAAHLLAINLVAGRDDELAGRARELAHSSAQAARRLTA